MDKEEVARLKQEKRERMRREALAAGGEEAGAEGSGDEGGAVEDFIPLDKGECRFEKVCSVCWDGLIHALFYEWLGAFLND